MPIRKYIAELLGTFILTLAVIISLAGAFPVPTPVIAALALGYGVYAMGGISGAHFNPAITLGLASVGKMSLPDTVLYLVMQLIGAALATLLAETLLTARVIPGVGPDVPMALAEMVGAFVFAFGVCAVAHGKVSQGASGLAVGGSLLLGISLAAGAGSNGILNPAVALGIGAFSPGYFLGPIIGAILGMQVYRLVGK